MSDFVLMSEWEGRVIDCLGRIESSYVDVSTVENRVPLDSHIQQFRSTIQADDGERFDVDRWWGEIVPVAENLDTECLLPVVQELSNFKNRSLLLEGVAVSISVLLDCLTQIPETLVEPAVSSLVEISARTEDLAQFGTALESVETVAESTGLCCRCLAATDGLNFIHPDTSASRVEEAAKDSHRRGEVSKLADLTAVTERANAGVWTEADLRGYSDESNSGEPFEKLIAHLWLDLGYDEVVVVNDSGGDGGIDVVASNRDRIVGIEAKRYDERTLRVGQVRRLAGVLPQHGFDQLFLVTSTTDITGDALTESDRVDGLNLVDGEALSSLLSKSSLPPPVFTD